MSPESGASTWTLLTFTFYLVCVYAIAFLAHQIGKGRSFVHEYYLGSRGLGTWTFALTFAATAASGGSFTGFPSLIYTHGWVLALWIAGYMVFPICAMGLLGKRLNQVARKGDSVTFPDVFRDRYDSPWLGLLTVVLLIFYLIVFLVAQFKAGGVLMQTMLEGNAGFGLLSRSLDGIASRFEGVSGGYLGGLAVFAACVVVYTAYGGFRAVVLTDVLQGLIMGFGVVALLPFALYTAYVYLEPASAFEPEGAAVVAPAPYAGKEERRAEPFRLSQLAEGLEKVNERLKREEPAAMAAPGYRRPSGPASGSIDPFLPVGMAVSFFILWPIAGAGQAGNMLRMMAFRDSRTLSRAIFAVTIFYGMIYIPLVIIFVCAKTLPLRIEQPDQAMPAMALLVAPPLLAGLLIAAPYAAIMSTVDSLLLMISSSLARDIYQRRINPNVTEKTMRWIGATTTAVVGALVALFAVNPPRFLQDLLVFGSSGQAATFLGAMALTLYWPRMNACGTACAMLSGFGAVSATYLIGRIQTGEFLPWTPLDLHPFVWGLCASLLGGVAGALLSSRPPERLVAKYFYRQEVADVPAD